MSDKPKQLMNVENGRILTWTRALEKLPNMVPVDPNTGEAATGVSLSVELGGIKRSLNDPETLKVIHALERENTELKDRAKMFEEQFKALKLEMERERLAYEKERIDFPPPPPPASSTGDDVISEFQRLRKDGLVDYVDANIDRVYSDFTTGQFLKLKSKWKKIVKKPFPKQPEPPKEPEPFEETE